MSHKRSRKHIFQDEMNGRVFWRDGGDAINSASAEGVK